MKTGINVISLGFGDPDLLTVRTLTKIHECKVLILRTGKHPIASWLKQNGIVFATLDHLYENAEDFDMLNRNIVNLLVSEASEHEIVYAVFDAVTDQTVRMLLQMKPDSLPVNIIPGLSIFDLNLPYSLNLLPDSAVLTVTACDLIDGVRYDPKCSLFVTELDNQILAGHVKLFLSDYLDDDYVIWLFKKQGKPIKRFLWELDRESGLDHFSALLIPGSTYLQRNRFLLNDLTEIMDKLRSASGCPWDSCQTHLSLRPYLIEEAWECVDSIDQDNMDHLSEELGDLLFQIVFHSSIGKSYDEFTINDVISSICQKMIRRHPHVFGSTELKHSESVTADWEQIKQQESGRSTLVSCLDDISTGLPSLKYASKILKKLLPAVIPGGCALSVLNEIHHLTGCLIADPSRINRHVLGYYLLLCTELCYVEEQDSELLLHQAADRLKALLKEAANKTNKSGISLEHLTFDDLGVYLEHVKDEIE